VVMAWRARTELEQRDRGDLFTWDKPGRRCKTGDWRCGKEGEEHCVVAGFPFPVVGEEVGGWELSRTQLSLKVGKGEG
jgi:hypothetical protein